MIFAVRSNYPYPVFGRNPEGVLIEVSAWGPEDQESIAKDMERRGYTQVNFQGPLPCPSTGDGLHEYGQCSLYLGHEFPHEDKEGHRWN